MNAADLQNPKMCPKHVVEDNCSEWDRASGILRIWQGFTFSQLEAREVSVVRLKKTQGGITKMLRGNLFFRYNP